MILWIDWAGLLVLLRLTHEAAVSCQVSQCLGSAEMAGIPSLWGLSSWASSSMVVSGFQEGKLQGTSIYKALACIMFADVSLAKASHMTKLRVNVRGVYTITWVLKGMIHWWPSLIQSTTHTRLCCGLD